MSRCEIAAGGDIHWCVIHNAVWSENDPRCEAVWCPIQGKWLSLEECVGGCAAPEMKPVCMMEARYGGTLELD